MERGKRIFAYLKMQDKDVALPPKKHKDALTVYFEVDDLLFHTFLVDENLGYMTNPGAK